MWNYDEQNTLSRKYKNLNDPFSSCLKLRCDPAGINGNWIVECSTMDYRNAPEIVRTIQYRLDNELEDMEKENEKKPD